MAGIGYSEGYLGALSQISGIQAQQQNMQMQRQQMQRQQQEAQQNQQEKGILSDVFKQQANQKNTMDAASQSDQLAQQYRQAGQKLMGVNPKNALEFLQEADKLTDKSAGNRLELAKAEKLKGEYLASLASGVQDQEGLNELVKKSAKEGQTIPQKYQTWNESTQKYLERSVAASMPISKQQDLALRTREIELRGQAEERKQKDEERKDRNDGMRETRLREGLDLRKKAAVDKATVTLGLRGEKEVEGEMNILKDMDTAGVFKTAPAGTQRAAAQDVHYRAQKILADSLIGAEEPVTKEEALDLARQQVVGEFKSKPGGWFGKDSAERVKGGVEQKTAAAPSMEESVKAAGSSYEPNLYDYKIEGGKVLRRKK